MALAASQTDTEHTDFTNDKTLRITRWLEGGLWRCSSSLKLAVGLGPNRSLIVPPQKGFISFCKKNSCHMLLNWMLSLAALAANFPGRSAGGFPTEVPALHGKGIDGFGRAPCWFTDVSLHAAQSRAQTFLQFCVRALVFLVISHLLHCLIMRSFKYFISN